MKNDPRVERDEFLGRGEERIDVYLGDAALLGDEQGEAHEQLLKSGRIDGTAAANALEGLGDPGPLDHAPGERRVERWQAERSVLDDLDQLATSAEEQHGAELGVRRRAQDELVAGVVDHGLDGHAAEMLGATLLGDRIADRGERVTHPGRIGQVEIHAANVGLVRDRTAEQLQDHRVTDALGCSDGIFGRARYDRLRDRNTVRREDALGLVLGQDRPAVGTDLVDDRQRRFAVAVTVLVDSQRGRLVEGAGCSLTSATGS